MLENLKKLWESTGIAQVFENQEDAWLWGKTLFMYLIVAVLVYLAVKKGFEPLLLLPIAAGMLLANLPGADLSTWSCSSTERIRTQPCRSSG